MPLLLSLLCVLLIAACQPIKAMDVKPQRHAPRLVAVDPRWWASLCEKPSAEVVALFVSKNIPIKDKPLLQLPREITIFDKQTPITDELLAELNPEWQKLSQTLSSIEKSKLLATMWFCKDGGDNSIKRCLFAQAVAIGADASTKVFDTTVLSAITASDDVIAEPHDYELIKYIVSKLTDEQKRNVQDAFQRVRSIHIAQVLLAAGVLMPKYILADCVSYLAPLELIHFYLEKGVDRANLDGPGFALQRCVSPFNKPSIYSPYVALLLDLGTNIKSLTSRGFTVFHHAAKENNPEFCECVVDYFLKKEKAAIISYLGCLRKKAPKFYSETKHLHRSLFKCFAPLAGLQEALEIKAQNYGIAYQIKPLEILNPANCTYAKLQLLRSAECPK